MYTLSHGKLHAFLCLLLFSVPAYSQNGIINGTVFDAKYNEPLIGASVFIDGTTIGGITDIDGNFRIENIKGGTYTIKASYVSYETASIPDVKVEPGKTSTLDIRLNDASLQLQNVVVVAQRKLGTEMAVLNTVRQSLPVANGISSQQISKTQDSDAAEVLRRIPGITIVEDRFVVVRGLAQRYNNVWLNNAITPSGETDKRAFSFDILPPSLIDNLMIYKSPSAEFPDWDYSELFDEANIAEDKIYMKESTNKSDSYTSSHLSGAAYLSARLKYRERLHLSLGVRMEHYRLKLNGYEADGIKEVKLNPSYTDFFPSVNISYNLDSRQQLRAAYGRSVNRPEFREIVPYVYYDFGLNANISGNAEIKNAYADNLDVRYEFYPSPGETVTLGAFYKYFDSPIEQTFSETGSGLQYTFHNAQKARTFGVEIDVKKRLDFIGLPDLSLVFNGALIKSKVFFAEGSFERDRPMQGQSPYLVNAGLFYQHDDQGISASVLYNRIGKRIETVGIPKQNPNDDIPDVYEMPRNSLDLTFSQKVGERVEIKAGVQDLLNAKTAYKQFLELTDATGNKREVEQLIRSFRPGIQVNLGISIKL